MAPSAAVARAVPKPSGFPMGLLKRKLPGLGKLTMVTLLMRFTHQEIVRRLRKSRDATVRKYAGAVGGLLSSLWLLILSRDARHTLLIYLGVRALQTLFNGKKTAMKRQLRKSGSLGSAVVKAGDSSGDLAIFSLSSGVVMYCYACRPEAIPSSYYKFILYTGPVPEISLKTYRAISFGYPRPVAEAAEWWAKRYPGTEMPKLGWVEGPVGCTNFHSQTSSCVEAVLRDTFVPAFRRQLKLYFVVNSLPYAVRFRDSLKDIPQTIKKVILGTIRSSTFLAAFVATYQACTCLECNLSTPRSRYVYALWGVVAGWSVLIEKKNRRLELGLYTLTRALDALVYLNFPSASDRTRAVSQMALLSVTMGVILHFQELEPEVGREGPSGRECLPGLIARAVRFAVPSPSH